MATWITDRGDRKVTITSPREGSQFVRVWAWARSRWVLVTVIRPPMRVSETVMDGWLAQELRLFLNPLELATVPDASANSWAAHKRQDTAARWRLSA